MIARTLRFKIDDRTVFEFTKFCDVDPAELGLAESNAVLIDVQLTPEGRMNTSLGTPSVDPCDHESAFVLSTPGCWMTPEELMEVSKENICACGKKEKMTGKDICWVCFMNGKVDERLAENEDKAALKLVVPEEN